MDEIDTTPSQSASAGTWIAAWAHTSRPRRQRGVTLMELAIVAALVALVSMMAIPAYQQYAQRSQVARAVSDIGRIDLVLNRFRLNNDDALPDSLAAVDLDGLLDPWGNPYVYLNIATARNKGKLRKDRNLVPINTDFDLYSMGPDGRSVAPLTAKHSRDDIVRANNGQFIGIAVDY